MKNFTRLVAVFAMSALGLGLNAQTDLQLNSFAISSASGNQVPPGHVTTVSYTIQNTGSVTIATGTVFIRTVSKGTTPVVGPDAITLGGDIAPGDSVTFTASGTYAFTESAFENICVSTVLDTSITETDTTNNLLCKNITISSSIEADIAIINTTIVAPNDLDGHDLDNGSEDAPDIEEISFQMINKGDISYIGSQSFAIEVYIDNDVIAAVASPGAMNNGDTSAVLGTTEATLIPVTPQEEGTYELCVRYAGGDANSENDTDCESFTLVDLYIPPPPVGIEENTANELNIYNSNKTIWVKNVSGNTTVTVIDVNGRLIASERMFEDGSISMETASAGVYVIRSSNEETGATSMHKVSIQ
ncbi:MAG TPA: hypothetical protein DCX14_07540 [Flavobacteriales bacterium]|nr:hypothetical protein [Flavobacteriales bacterium]